LCWCFGTRFSPCAAHVRYLLLRCESQVNTAVEKLEVLLQEKDAAVHQRIDALAQRIEEVDQRFSEESARLTRDTEERVASLHELFDRLTTDFEVERKERLDREGKILHRQSAHEVDAAEKFKAERTSRENAVTALRTAFEENVRVRAKADEDLHRFVQEELAALKNAVSAEAVVREREDDEIVDALNRYTRKLQDSLQIINSPDI